jgi:hypothetical protein
VYVRDGSRVLRREGLADFDIDFEVCEWCWKNELEVCGVGRTHVAEGKSKSKCGKEYD